MDLTSYLDILRDSTSIDKYCKKKNTFENVFLKDLQETFPPQLKVVA